jgi:hypothetical protein
LKFKKKLNIKINLLINHLIKTIFMKKSNNNILLKINFINNQDLIKTKEIKIILNNNQNKNPLDHNNTKIIN